MKEILDINYCDVEGNITEVAETLEDEIKEQQKIIDKPVLIYSSDIREGNGHTYDDPYRTEVAFNQFLYGVILSLTNGKGFMSWEEVKKELEKLGGN
ncbi:nucleoside 2-deoxyribosyltransferase [Staphylococcus phage S-CoN_Ph17]|nr:nucleoside 2-deoxyribosyltransferase [Staphylococcus phage S-CoN_Ph17]